MAEEEKDTNEEPDRVPDAEEKTKAGKKLPLKIILVFVLAALSLSGGLLASVGLEGVGKLINGSSVEAPQEKAEEEEAPSEENNVEILNFDEMIVNITGYTASGRKTTRFLKVKLSLVYTPETEGPLVERRIFMRDAFQDYLRQLNEREIQGTYGFLELKRELLKRAKTIAGNDSPKEILIGEFIIQ